jgi:hypothetical protein
MICGSLFMFWYRLSKKLAKSGGGSYPRGGSRATVTPAAAGSSTAFQPLFNLVAAAAAVAARAQALGNFGKRMRAANDCGFELAFGDCAADAKYHVVISSG